MSYPCSTQNFESSHAKSFKITFQIEKNFGHHGLEFFALFAKIFVISLEF